EPGDSPQWTVEQIKQALARGQPVVAIVDSRRLPGHPADDRVDEQPLVLIGATADGLVYSDPTFSSSLGYALEISDADFVTAWEGASPPRRALAFVTRPRLLPREAHLRPAEPPEANARVYPTPT